MLLLGMPLTEKAFAGTSIYDIVGSAASLGFAIADMSSGES